MSHRTLVMVVFVLALTASCSMLSISADGEEGVATVSTLEDLKSAVGNSNVKEIRLNADIGITDNLIIVRTVSIDLSGHSIRSDIVSGNMIRLEGDGSKLTISNGSIHISGTNYAISLDEGTELVSNNVNYYCDDPGNGGSVAGKCYSILMYGSTVTINGGFVSTGQSSGNLIDHRMIFGSDNVVNKVTISGVFVNCAYVFDGNITATYGEGSYRLSADPGTVNKVNSGHLQDYNDGVLEVGPYHAKVGDVYYLNLQDAIDACPVGGTVDVVADITMAVVSYEINKDLTLNLDGFTITRSIHAGDLQGMFVTSGNVMINGGTVRSTLLGESGTCFNVASGKIICNGTTVTGHRFPIVLQSGADIETEGVHVTSEKGMWSVVLSYGSNNGTFHDTVFEGPDFMFNMQGGQSNFSVLSSRVNTDTLCVLSNGASGVIELVGSEFEGSTIYYGEDASVVKAGPGSKFPYGIDPYEFLSDETLATNIPSAGQPYEVIKAVAKTDDRRYGSISDAISKAVGGSTVTLVSNGDVTSTISVLEKVSIDLGGYTVTGDACDVFDLTVEGTSISNGTISSVEGRTGIILPSGASRIANVSFGGSGSAIRVVEGSDVVLSDVVVQSSSFVSGENGTIALSGSFKTTDPLTFSSTGIVLDMGGLAISNKVQVLEGSLTVGNGTIQSTDGPCICVESGSFVASEGLMLSGDGTAFEVRSGASASMGSGSVETGGLFSGDGTLTLGSSDYPTSFSSTASFGDVSPIHVKVLGGMYSEDPYEYIPADLDPRLSSIQEVPNGHFSVEPATVKVGDRHYVTLGQAVGVDETEATIDLVADASVSSSSFTIDGSRTIRLGSFTMMVDGGIDLVSGVFVFEGGTIVSSSGPCISVSGATVTLDSVSMNGGLSAICVDSGTLALGDGSVATSGGECLTVTGGAVCVNGTALTDRAGSAINISGGSAKLMDVELDSRSILSSNGGSVLLTGNTVFKGSEIFGPTSSSTSSEVLEITGGSYGADPRQYVGPGLAAEKGSTGMWLVGKLIATIGDVGYTSFATAVSECAEGGMIEVLDDISLDADFTISKSVTLSLDTHSISSGFLFKTDSGVLTIEGGALINNGNVPCIMVGDRGSLVMNGTSLEGNVCISAEDDSTVSLESCTISANAVCVRMGGGVVFDSMNCAYSGNDATAVAMDADSSATITGGTIDTSVMKAGHGMALNVAGDVVAHVGSFGEGVVITGGEYSIDPTSCLPTGYEACSDGSMWAVGLKAPESGQVTRNVYITVKDGDGSPKPGVKVSLYSGSDLVAFGITDSEGTVILHADPGVYNVITDSTDGGQEITKRLVLEDADVSMDLILPDPRVSITVTGETDIQPDNLGDLVGTIGTEKTEINLNADSQDDAGIKQKLDSVLSSYRVGQYIDVTLVKKTWQSGSTIPTMENMDELSVYLRFSIGISDDVVGELGGMSVYSSIKVVREHVGTVSEMVLVSDEAAANAYDGECYYIEEVAGSYFVMLKASKFSTYGIAYSLPAPVSPPVPPTPPTVEFEDGRFYITVVVATNCEYIVRDVDESDVSGWCTGVPGAVIRFGPFDSGSELTVISRNVETGEIIEDEVEETPKMPIIQVTDQGRDFVSISTEEDVAYILVDGDGSTVGAAYGSGGHTWDGLDPAKDHYVIATCTVGEMSLTAGPELVKPGVDTFVSGDVRHKGIYISVNGGAEGYSYCVRDGSGNTVGEWTPFLGEEIRFGPFKPGNSYDVLSSFEGDEIVEKSFTVPKVLGGEGAKVEHDSVTVTTEVGNRYMLTDQNGNSVTDSSGRPVWIDGDGGDVIWEGLDPNGNYYLEVVSGDGMGGVGFGPMQIKEASGEASIGFTVNGEYADITLSGTLFGREYRITDGSGMTVIDWTSPEGEDLHVGLLGLGMSFTVWSREGPSGEVTEEATVSLPPRPDMTPVGVDASSVTICTVVGVTYMLMDAEGNPVYDPDARKRVEGTGENVTWVLSDPSKGYYLRAIVVEDSGLFEIVTGPVMVHEAAAPMFEYDVDSGKVTVCSPDDRKEYALRFNGAYGEWNRSDGSALVITIPEGVDPSKGLVELVSRYASTGYGENVEATLPGSIPVPEVVVMDDTSLTIITVEGLMYTLVDPDGTLIPSGGRIQVLGDGEELRWAGLDRGKDYRVIVRSMDYETGLVSERVCGIKSAAPPEPDPEPEPIVPVAPAVSEDRSCHWWVSLLIVVLYGIFMRFVYREGPFDRFAWVTAAIFMIAVLTVAATHMCVLDLIGLVMMVIAIVYYHWYFGTGRGGFSDPFSYIRDRIGRS